MCGGETKREQANTPSGLFPSYPFYRSRSTGRFAFCKYSGCEVGVNYVELRVPFVRNRTVSRFTE